MHLTMASSSSRSYQTHLKNTEQDFNFFKDEKSSKALQHDDEEEEDWLKLGLGLGTSTSSSSPWKKIVVSHNPILVSPSSLSSTSQKLCSPQIGLGLGFEDQGSGFVSRKGKEGLENLNLSNDHHHHHNDDDNGKVIGSSSLSLSSSCEIMNPRGEEDLAMKFPSDSHHYLARNNHNQSGFWFTLRSFTNRNGEALPQISKEYIRVKDENMTVLMVKKYLVTKLGLSNEDEIDVSCMGESLSHVQTLKQVRDTIWLPRLVEYVDSTTLSLGDFHEVTMNHLMSLIYQKHYILN
ncbi:uncharacterized protein LOC131655432 [Vicia villosa]|uniref:uncharacterized protein LOC131655432 n=1 Tax=Vicia villosa TaxID=3911 RepID=UPI00273BC3FF|nr:uncharacterized protein LOC131655432 [Vicia villosa]